MTELGLAASKLAEDFADAHALEATFENGVPLLAAGGDAEAALALVAKLLRGDEAIHCGLSNVNNDIPCGMMLRQLDT